MLQASILAHTFDTCNTGHGQSIPETTAGEGDENLTLAPFEH